MNDQSEQAAVAAEKLTWDPKQAAVWSKWFPVLEKGAQVLSDRLVELAELAPGDYVLDLATGLGEPAATAARAVAPGGRVDGLDLSAGMLEFARRRARTLGLDNMEFREADADALQLPPGAYDAVLCRWGLMFAADASVTLRALHAALAPEGRFATAIWGSPDNAPALSLGNRVVLKHLGMPPPAEAAGTPFSLSDVEAFMETVSAAGFHDVRGEWLPVTFAFESCEEFLQFRRERSASLEKRIAHFPSDRREAAWRAVAEAARAYADESGAVRMENHAFVVAARR